MSFDLVAEAIDIIKKDFSEMGKVHDTRMNSVWDLMLGYEALLKMYNYLVDNAAVITVTKPVNQTIKS